MHTTHNLFNLILCAFSILFLAPPKVTLCKGYSPLMAFFALLPISKLPLRPKPYILTIDLLSFERIDKLLIGLLFSFEFLLHLGFEQRHLLKKKELLKSL